MAGLSTYRAKRRFGVTAEPKGALGRKSGQAFVIQKHAARRLHYDLRLELDGVMKSWAVTRGPSLVPGEKRLAVQVEDHPIDYNTFEGTIPQGEYGGGTVMIWDRGRWHPDQDPHRGLQKGHLTFTLDGERLHGHWHLVRMQRRRGEKRDNWLLIKSEDEAARGPKDRDILDEAMTSVTTGRSMDEIAEGAAKRKARAPKRKSGKATTAKIKTTVRRKRPAPRKRSHARASANDAPLPDFVPPELATLADKAPDGERWVHEIKFDGYRMQARRHGKQVIMLTRTGLDWTKRFSRIAAAVAALPAERALIDGEIVVEDQHGVASFSLLQQDLKAGRQDRMAYYAFDLLHLDGQDLRTKPLHARKEALAGLLAAAPATGPLRLSESIAESGPVLHKHACQLGLEGIVSKLADAPYRSGRNRDWLKTKCADRQEFVIAGFKPSTADAHAIGALVLGVNDGGELRYAGRTGTGFTHVSARDLYRRLKALQRDKPAFGAVPAEERGARKPIWVEPKLVAEVEFRGWTHEDHVRQASFQGLREDKPAGEVVREVPRAITAASKTTAKKRGPAVTGRAKPDVAGIALSHPDRVYWNDVGITKRDLADFYTTVWPWMAPHLVGRPIALLRCPEGASGQCFFQKHASAGLSPEWLHLIAEDGDKIITVDDLPGLISLVQAGVLEIHTRGSHGTDTEFADRLVFDLDPGPGVGWSEVVAAARDVRARLSSLKLKTWLKTTGGKGLHVVLPIAPTPWDDAKTFAHALAALMAADAPDRYTAALMKNKRGGRIFIDYLRNSREATAVAPYSTRARPGAPVSTPIDWSELGRLKSASQYTVQNLPARLSRLRKDPWAGIGRVRQKLPKIK